MTGPNEPKVSNIPPYLDEYGAVYVHLKDRPTLLFRRDAHGQWWAEGPEGPVSFSDWVREYAE